ncbi:MAG: phospholipase D-like domain-containing protein [Burkholderiales bacterium]
MRGRPEAVIVRVIEPKYAYPWRAGNRFDLLVDGPAFFARMLEAISTANRHVLFECYLFESGEVADRFIEALIRAARQGARVMVLLDGYGALGLRPEDRHRLERGGVDLAFYNALHWQKGVRNLLRDHRKLVVVDGVVGFVGGAGVTDEFDPQREPHMRWRETMLEIHGPVVVDWQDLFASTWRSAGQPAALLSRPDAAALDAGFPARVTVTDGVLRHEITRTVIRRIAVARQRVWIATAYFLPSLRLRRALAHAARRGVEVNLLLPGPHTDHPAVRHAGRRYYRRLLRHGVRIFEYQPRFLHAKAVLCDEWASVGSSNLDRWNLRWNLEANQEVDDPRFATKLAAIFEHDFAESSEITRSAWERRPWRLRLLESVWGSVGRWLHSWRHPGAR